MKDKLAFRLAATLTAAASPSFAQLNPTNMNDLPLSNGRDAFLTLSDPSQAGDLYWKVIPADALLSASGRMEVAAFEFELFDTDWSTSALIYDLLFTVAKPSTTHPGSLEPDLNDPGSFVIFGGPSGFPDPCSVSPALCSAVGCAPGGAVNGYFVNASFSSTCTPPGSGLVLRADGQTDHAVTAFLPAGMSLGGAAQPTCGVGDYSLMTGYSTDERQADWLGTGYSAYGGRQLGSLPGFTPDLVKETATLSLQFCDPILVPRVEAGGGPELGLAGLHLALGSSARYGYTVFDEDGIGDTADAYFTLLPPLAPPGVLVMGASVLLDFSDRVIGRSHRSGTVLLQSGGGIPFDDGVFESAPLTDLPAGAAGLTLHAQATVLDAATMLARATQLARTHLHP